MSVTPPSAAVNSDAVEDGNNGFTDSIGLTDVAAAAFTDSTEIEEAEEGESYYEFEERGKLMHDPIHG